MENWSKKIISLPVLSVNEGEHLGFVKSLIVDPINKEIIAFAINRGWFKDDKIIPFNRVKSIGDNAIVIDKSGTAEKPTNLPQIMKLLKNPVQLINSKVVSTSGKALGQVDEFMFDETGKITKLEISGRMIEGIWKGKAALPCQEVVTMGKDVIMVSEGAEKRLIPSSKYLRKTMSDLKSATSKAWDATVQSSQKLGHAIAGSINKLAEEEKDTELNDSEIIPQKDQIQEEKKPEEPVNQEIAEEPEKTDPSLELNTPQTEETNEETKV